MKNKLFILFISSLFLFSCSGSNNEYASKTDAGYEYEETTEESSVDEMATESVDETSPQNPTLNSETSAETTPIKVSDRKIIKEGEISFETKNVKSARIAIDSIVKKYGAYISGDNETKYSEKVQQTITIRVPFAKFDELLASIVNGVDYLDSRNIRASDVTEEYLDVQSRIKNKKKLEERFTEILKEARSVDDILNVERQIGQLREEIESAEGRLRYLENRTSLSTLTVTFYEYHESEKGFGSEFGRGFVNGWNSLVWFLVGLVNIWPFLIIIGLVVWFIIRKYSQRKK